MSLSGVCFQTSLLFARAAGPLTLFFGTGTSRPGLTEPWWWRGQETLAAHCASLQQKLTFDQRGTRRAARRT